MRTGMILRDIGMAAALKHAEDVTSNWGSLALAWLEAFPGKEFMTEDVRVWSHENGLEKPPSARAWGAVMTKAKKAGLIESIGYGTVKNPKAHATPATLWRKVDFYPYVPVSLCERV